MDEKSEKVQALLDAAKQRGADLMADLALAPKSYRRGLQPGNATLYDLEIGYNPGTGKLACIWWREGGSGGVAICFTAGEFAAPGYVAEKMGTRWADTVPMAAAFNAVSDRLAALPGFPLPVISSNPYEGFEALVEAAFNEVEVDQREKRERGEGYPLGL